MRLWYECVEKHAVVCVARFVLPLAVCVVCGALLGTFSFARRVPDVVKPEIIYRVTRGTFFLVCFV